MTASNSICELRRLLQQSSHYVVGLVATMAVGFVSFPIFTRIFSVEDFGLIDFTQKILLLMTAASKLGMQNSAMRFYDGEAFAKDADQRRAYYSTMFFGVLAMATAVTVIFVVALRTLPMAAVSGPLVAILSFASILILLRAMQSILWSFLRIEERTKAYNITTFIIRAGTVAAVVGLLPLLGVSVRTYYIAAIAVEFLLVAVVAAPLFFRRVLNPADFNAALFRSSCLFGFPLVLQELFWIVLDSGDRGLVQYYLGANALGFYSVAYGLSTYLNTMLVVPLGLAITPIYLRIWRTEGSAKTSEFLSLGLDLLLLAAGGIMMVVALVARDGITLLASPKYRGADSLIPLIVAGLLLYTTQVFFTAGLMIHKRTPLMAAVLCVSALSNIAFNCLLLPRIGLLGAALSTFLSYALCTLLLARAAYKVLPLNFKPRRVCCYALAGAVSWFSVSPLDLQVPALNVVAKAGLGATLYLGILFVVDRRIRAGIAGACRWMYLRVNSRGIVTA